MDFVINAAIMCERRFSSAFQGALTAKITQTMVKMLTDL